MSASSQGRYKKSSKNAKYNKIVNQYVHPFLQSMKRHNNPGAEVLSKDLGLGWDLNPTGAPMVLKIATNGQWQYEQYDELESKPVVSNHGTLRRRLTANDVEIIKAAIVRTLEEHDIKLPFPD